MRSTILLSWLAFFFFSQTIAQQWNPPVSSHPPKHRVEKLQMTDSIFFTAVGEDELSGDPFMLKSVDGGANWTDVTVPNLPAALASLESHVIVSSTIRIYQGKDGTGAPLIALTTDSGSSYRIVDSLGAFPITQLNDVRMLEAEGNATILASDVATGGRVMWKVIDSTFLQITMNGLPAMADHYGPAQITGSQGDTLIWAINDSNWGSRTRFYESIDGGSNWAFISEHPDSLVTAKEVQYRQKIRRVEMCVVFEHSQNGQSIEHSPDGGLSWINMTKNGLGNYGNDITAIAHNSDDRVVLAARDSNGNSQLFYMDFLINQWKPLEEAAVWQVFPNPSSDVIFIQPNANSSGKSYSWELLDLAGRMIKSGQSRQVSLNELGMGLYLLRITSGKNIMTHRVVRQ